VAPETVLTKPVPFVVVTSTLDRSAVVKSKVKLPDALPPSLNVTLSNVKFAIVSADAGATIHPKIAAAIREPNRPIVL
jgi:hypothetical protein